MERLAREPFILFKKNSSMQNLIDKYFQRICFRPYVVMRSDSAEAIKAKWLNRNLGGASREHVNGN